MEDGVREITSLSPEDQGDHRQHHLHQTTEFLWDFRRTDRPLDTKEEQRCRRDFTFTGLDDRSNPGCHDSKQADGVVMELMAPPTHPVHLFEKQPDDEGVSAARYANFVHGATSSKEPSEAFQAKPSPVAILLLASAGNYNTQFSFNLSDPKPPATFLSSRSSELLMAIASSVHDAVQEPAMPSDGEEEGGGGGGGGGGGEGKGEGEGAEAPYQNRVCDNEYDQLRAAICDHPLYPDIVLAHLEILKIGAPRELHDKLDDVSKKFQRVYEGGRYTSKLVQDPELDYFMKSYVVMLTSFREDLEEPFDKFMQFMDKTTKDLEDLCGHYVETKPEEEDNYGFDVGPREGAQDKEIQVLPGEHLTISAHLQHDPTDIDESIVVDPDAPEEELKKVLMRKYGRHIGGLKAEFNRVRKKGKLPDEARRILKQWFNHHSHWPYPSEMEKASLQRLCELDLKQINNWFINERKRHWNSEERSMYPIPKFPDDDAGGEGSGPLEQ